MRAGCFPSYPATTALPTGCVREGPRNNLFVLSRQTFRAEPRGRRAVQPENAMQSKNDAVEEQCC
jgi:hypothetical protein